jgi:hypothetical protein
VPAGRGWMPVEGRVLTHREVRVGVTEVRVVGRPGVVALPRVGVAHLWPELLVARQEVLRRAAGPMRSVERTSRWASPASQRGRDSVAPMARPPPRTFADPLRTRVLVVRARRPDERYDSGSGSDCEGGSRPRTARSCPRNRSVRAALRPVRRRAARSRPGWGVPLRWTCPPGPGAPSPGIACPGRPGTTRRSPW